jgi:uncharacterized protein
MCNNLLKNIVLSSLLAPVLCAAQPANVTPTGIPLDTEWKQKIYHYAENNIKHSAWGLAHSERDYQVSIMLAKKEGIKIDTDILFAAAFLHDIGAIDPFKEQDVEHSLRSVTVIKPLLKSSGFPMKKWAKVKAAILGHMYYAEVPTAEEAIVLHDADVLDFLGMVGIVRLISVTERHSWAPNLAGTFTTLHQFKIDLPSKLITNSAKQMAAERLTEMDQFFKLLDKETVTIRHIRQ